MIGDPAQVAASLDAAGFTEEELEAIGWRNAERLGFAAP